MFNSIKTPHIAFLLVAAIWTSGCAAIHYQVHPGALNHSDSVAYDSLLVAQGIIDQARLDYQTGNSPAKATDALNSLIAAYNAARQSWLTYRVAVTANAPVQPYLDGLNRNISELVQAIRRLKEAK